MGGGEKATRDKYGIFVFRFSRIHFSYIKSLPALISERLTLMIRDCQFTLYEAIYNNNSKQNNACSFFLLRPGPPSPSSERHLTDDQAFETFRIGKHPALTASSGPKKTFDLGKVFGSGGCALWDRGARVKRRGRARARRGEVGTGPGPVRGNIDAKLWAGLPGAPKSDSDAKRTGTRGCKKAEHRHLSNLSFDIVGPAWESIFSV